MPCVRDVHTFATKCYSGKPRLLGESITRDPSARVQRNESLTRRTGCDAAGQRSESAPPTSIVSKADEAVDVAAAAAARSRVALLCPRWRVCLHKPYQKIWSRCCTFRQRTVWPSPTTRLFAKTPRHRPWEFIAGVWRSAVFLVSGGDSSVLGDTRAAAFGCLYRCSRVVFV